MAGTVSPPRPAPGGEEAGTCLGPVAAPRAIAARRGLLAGLPRPLVVFHALTLAAAFGVWAYFDRNLWFFGDEWDFLTRRGLHGADFSIWAPHNEHWSTLPILVWRALFCIAHLSSYWPYLVPLLLAHVAVVHLVWRRCLRVGADPWVASAVALLFALFGTGAEDLAWAFQIGFVGSLVFGLLAIEVADGPAWPGARTLVKDGIGRDLTTAALALAALMCSGVGVATTFALGIVLLAHDGWRRAVRALCLPATAYLVWFMAAGRAGLAATGDSFGASVVLKVPTFVATNLKNDLGHTAGWHSCGAALAVVVLLWLLLRSPRLVRWNPSVLAGAAAAVVFYAMAAFGRDRINAALSPSRYAYVGVALLMPALALMLSAVWVFLGFAPERLGRHVPKSVPDAPSRSRVATRAFFARLRPGAAPGASGGGTARADGMAEASGAPMPRSPWRHLRLAVLAVVAAATVANLASGLQFARSRTLYVTGLKDQILTTAALLQQPGQMARAVNLYPVWASGFASGYVTPQVLSGLYRRHLLPRPAPASMTGDQVRADESWLDLRAGGSRLFGGPFRLMRTAGAEPSVRTAGLVGGGGNRGTSVSPRRGLAERSGPMRTGRAAWSVSSPAAAGG